MGGPYTPGPGDLLPPFSGHPHDPRMPEESDDVQDAKELVAEIRLWLGMADIGIQRGDMVQFLAAMETAQKHLNGIDFGKKQV